MVFRAGRVGRKSSPPWHGSTYDPYDKRVNNYDVQLNNRNGLPVFATILEANNVIKRALPLPICIQRTYLDYYMILPGGESERSLRPEV